MTSLDQFVDAVIASPSQYTAMDRIYVHNRVLGLVGEGEPVAAADDQLTSLTDALVETAIQNGKIEASQSDRDILADQLMDLVTPLPSVLNQRFWDKYQDSPKAATDYFFNLSKANDYIKTRAIAKNVVFPAKTAFGDLEITINLSKPEKDPKAIAAARNQPQDGYPLCQLCMQNEGYLGRLGYPARSNHRIVRLTLGGDTWGFQYSPYAYFNEHSIFLDQEHRPMVINRQTFTNLLEIVRQFPHYFVGSNADLPIVGGSMLSHEHYQGGRHDFPMMKAPIARSIDLGIAGVKAGIVKWPMSTIRLSSPDVLALTDAAVKIHDIWMNYSDESVDVRAYTDGTRHHTTTPIARKVGDDYVLDIVLRDNQTSAEFPDGIFHPHQDVQHIKKENIGLIEVMGRAILPARLKTELAEVGKYLLDQPNEMVPMHQAWADQLKADNTITADNVTTVIDKAVGNVFARVLADAGVFKWDDQGEAAFDRFIATLKD
ncbi:UDP-glucose--hexose-1-phosphate uridylyltransferase [Lactiplantibacillus pentosus]|mgnify:FL=1|jgi:UDPglucose--hexose-1-phosphate uridylyltransferase|uniref:Galactose-1-phosphate uridylyltransferase n=3 Tax=Lactiplantibacillus pentosus TaxID=1589 RepID=A0AAX6LE46_LACPE|nr:UDP-glucose--hexose-1-phosphate uridylyltransferase [Lactiplantibacillus pentosus]ASG80001.1 galactose-1-phosphate uridylyltransferase [Lactiplantibacillus pentosus]AYG38675.1 UDP-glucose--hexose-1-phosphate uridylyltransferase [Lactiplantibacillus pentosus]AYG41335.1 UDP-glucose--hexose-1-phosphate uridylyltransferase [Lactiplantibacillus pentosus]AYJ43279.1 UDP-glucose--hexose-1-phosphate uridylyltransferase [Lactiplantibacillus pentosus]KRK23389.1 galactose-1-phosphate uridylyltransferas